MSLRDRIENNLAIWLLSMLLTGFLAGIGTYKTIIEIAHLKVISENEYNNLINKKKDLKSDNKNLTNKYSSSFLISANTVEIIPELKCGIAVTSEDNYNKLLNRIQITIYLRPDPNELITNETLFIESTIQKFFWLDVNETIPIQVSNKGVYEFRVEKFSLNSSNSEIETAIIRINSTN